MQLPTIVKRSLAVLGVVILLAAAFFVWQLVQSRQNHTTATPKQGRTVVASQVCTDDIIKQASPLMADSQTAALSAVVKTIETKENYNGDVNCDYIRVSYYTATGDVETAQTALDDMRFAREAGSQYSLLFNPPVAPVADLQRAIDIQKSIQASQQPEDSDMVNEMDKVGR